MIANDEGNPLAEVGLALSMAFFSLMILMLVAVLNTPKINDSLHIEGQNKNGSSEDMQFFAYSFGKLYDKDLNERDLEDIIEERKIIIAVDPNLEIKNILELTRNLDSNSFQIATLTDDWIKRIRQLEGGAL